ncbi:MAG: hypothetical protein H7Y42_04495 [Chitinophagaceae bacterium]|nr:hypothetical protein [Chitinophagaceae bacterium]
MTQQQTSIKDKIAQAEAAAKLGLLADYAPAVPKSGKEPQQSSKSWGSAMRR